MKQTKPRLSVDDQLSEHLSKAEYHLIRAVEMFAEKKSLTRRNGYLSRLVRSQETVTGLYREELVRQRGSKGVKGRKSSK